MQEVLSAIPTEVLTGFASAGLGIYAKLASIRAETARMQTELALAHMQAATASANAAAGRGGKWIRRILAIMAGSYLFLWPAVFGLLYCWGYYVPTAVLYTQEGGGFWIFSSSKAKIEAMVQYGFVVTSLHTHLGASVFGFYFGSGMTERTRR